MVPCIDENENCPWWADIGECHNNPNYMLANCRYSCKQCDDGDPDELGCKDFFTEDCPKWAAIDLCKRDSWVAKYCRVSCKQKCVKRKSSKPGNKLKCIYIIVTLQFIYIDIFYIYISAYIYGVYYIHIYISIHPFM